MSEVHHEDDMETLDVPDHPVDYVIPQGRYNIQPDDYDVWKDQW